MAGAEAHISRALSLCWSVTASTAINQDMDHKFHQTTQLDFDRKGRIDVHQFTSRTSEEGVFAGGDTSPWGANVAVNAIADGKESGRQYRQVL